MGEGWINVYGKKQEVIEKFQETGLSRQSAEKLLALLTKEKNLICADETYQMDLIKEKSDGKMLGLMLLEYNYFINIRNCYDPLGIM